MNSSNQKLAAALDLFNRYGYKAAAEELEDSWSKERKALDEKFEKENEEYEKDQKRRDKIRKLLLYGLPEDEIKQQLDEEEKKIFNEVLEATDWDIKDEKRTGGLVELRNKIKITPGDAVVMTDGLFQSFGSIPQTTNRKPRGLWYACGLDWLNFLISNRFATGDYNYVYKISINYSQILSCSNEKQLSQLTAKYGKSSYYTVLSEAQVPPSDPRYIHLQDLAAADTDKTGSIDWNLFSKDYAGIQICPYVNDFDAPWYRSWDIASGCIWNGAAIKESKLLAKRIDDFTWEL